MRILKTSERTGTLVLGAGNPIVGDDGIGIAALDSLRERFCFESDVELVDGGTWGMNLLPMIETTRRLLILDAVRANRAAGELVELAREDLPRFLSLKLSPHQIDLREVLALAELRDTLPEHIIVLGIQPDRIEMGIGLSPVVTPSLDALVTLAVDRLRGWGHTVTPRAEPAYA
jgi:hydrogenase maturation protease